MLIDDMQFGFMHGKGNTDAFSSCDKFKIGTKPLWKAFDKSPEGGGEMGFEEAGCGRVAHPHSYGPGQR